MKKLIAISVVFALIAGVAFAVDLGGTVIGSATLFQSDTGDDAKVTSSGTMNRIRIDGGGEAGDGVYGGYVRFGDGNYDGNAWWKPIDQFKLMVGGNGGDGFLAKEGVTGWMFYQTPCDTDVADNGNTWGGGYSNWPYIFRSAFYGGGKDGKDDVYLFITPVDMLAINLQIPFISEGGKETADVFAKTIAQLDLKLDFGNIALTYRGDSGEGNDQPKVFAYFGGSFGDLALDVGLGYQFANEDDTANPVGIGFGLKYAADAFGVKFRGLVNLGGEDKNTNIMADVMPYFGLGDNLTAFVSVGVTMAMPDGGDSVLNWHFNPYIQVGEEWGAKFVGGLRVWSANPLDGSDGVINWAVPVGVIVSF